MLNDKINNDQIYDLAEQGFSLIPLGSKFIPIPDNKLKDRFGGDIEKANKAWPKTSLVSWKKYQTTIPSDSQIDRWISQYPSANWAIITGPKVVVIDADSKEACDYLDSGVVTRTPWQVRTGRGKHYYYQTNPKLELKNSVNQNLKIDFRGYGGYVVAPGSTHYSGHKYHWEPCESGDDIDCIADLPMLNEQDLSIINGYNVENNGGDCFFDATKITQKATTEAVKEGGRNNAAASLTGQYIQKGHNLHDVFNILSEWNQTNNPPLSSSELNNTISSIAQKHANEHGPILIEPLPKQKFDIVNTTLQTKPAPLDWVIDKFLVKKTVSMVYGAPGACKSFIAQDWGMSVATGTKWHDYRVREGGVLYVCGEGQEDLPNRIAAWKQHQGMSEEEIFPFFHTQHEINLSDRENIDQLIEQMEEIAKGGDFQLVIIDTLSTNFGGCDENSGDMTAFITNINSLAKRTNTHCCIVHHSGKDTSKGGRGHSSQHCDVYTYIAIEQAEIKEKAYTKVIQKKQKGGEKLLPILFNMELINLGIGKDSWGEEALITSLVPVLENDTNHGDSVANQLLLAEEKKAATNSEAVVLRIIQETVREIIKNKGEDYPLMMDAPLFNQKLLDEGIARNRTDRPRKCAMDKGWLFNPDRGTGKKILRWDIDPKVLDY